MTKNIKKFSCPYCSFLDEKEDIVKEHITESHFQDIEEIKIAEYVCEMCNKSFEIRMDAFKCEEKHRNNEDYRYQDYLVQKEKEKLEDASNHPEQKKLF